MAGPDLKDVLAVVDSAPGNPTEDKPTAAKTTPKITTWTADELVNLDFPEARWAVQGIVPEGLTILAGRPKQGKSWLLLSLGIAIASGGMALGSVEVEEGDVYYLALEDNPRRLKGRLLSLLQGAAPPKRLRLSTACPRVDQGGLKHLDSWLTEHRDARLVIVDTLARFRPAKVKEQGYTADYAAIEPLQNLAGEHGVALVVAHHQRKLAAEDDWIDSVSGTLGLAGAADGLLGLFRQRGDNAAVLKATGRDLEEAEFGLRFDPAIGSWALLANVSDAKLTDQRREVAKVVAMLGSATPTTVRPYLDGNKTLDATKKLMWQMSEAGQLARANGHYSLPVTEELR